MAESFFDRARARLTLQVPPSLTDPLAQGARGDLDLNPSMWERAGVAATSQPKATPPIAMEPSTRPSIGARRNLVQYTCRGPFGWSAQRAARVSR